MAGNTYPEMRVPYRLYIGDDEGVYLSAPADGKIKVTADAGGADDIELQGGITLDGNITVDTGHYFIFSDDSTSASGGQLTSVAQASGMGYIKVTIGGETGYIPVMSSNCAP